MDSFPTGGGEDYQREALAGEDIGEQLTLHPYTGVIAIASAAKSQSLMDLGCKGVVDRDALDLETEIRRIAGGPVDVALDVVGGRMFMPMINALRQRGRYSTSGSISGPMVEFDLRQLVYKDLQLTGATITHRGCLPVPCA